MEHRAALREPAERLDLKRSHRLADVAAEGLVREEIVQALAAEALVGVGVDERAVSRSDLGDGAAVGRGEDARAAVLEQVRLGVGAALHLALLGQVLGVDALLGQGLGVDRAVDHLALLGVDRVLLIGLLIGLLRSLCTLILPVGSRDVPGGWRPARYELLMDTRRLHPHTQ